MPTITTFADVQNALNNFITDNNMTLKPPHGNFWENGSTPDEQYNNFVTGQAISGYPILQKGSGKDSNIIKALSGITPFDGSAFQRMPPSFANPNNAYLDADTIEGISRRIDASRLNRSSGVDVPPVGPVRPGTAGGGMARGSGP